MKVWDKLREYQEHKALLDSIDVEDKELRAFFQSELDAERKAILKQNELALSGVLDNARVKELLIKAEGAGLVEGRNWLGTKETLAYFVEKICNECSIYYNNIEGHIYWKPFESYFLIDKLSGAKSDYLKLYPTFTPNGCDKIDKLFTP